MYCNSTQSYSPCNFLFSLVPSPEVMVYAAESVVVSGSSLYLTCSIQPSSVDTPTTVMSSWTAPQSTYDRVNAADDTSVELVISSVETADSGQYTCTATQTDSSGSAYVMDSETADNTASIVISEYIRR